MSKRVTLAPGIVTDPRTADMLAEAARRFGKPLQFAQGSYRPTTNYSGSTHAGGGAVDVRTVPLRNHAEKMRLVKALRLVGFAAWYREPIAGLWGEHIHCIAIGCPDLSSGAQWQVGEYRAGRNGLTDRARDPQAGLGVEPRTWEKYQRQWPLVTKLTGAAVFDVPGGHKVGRKKHGVRVHVLDKRYEGRVQWLRLKAGWVKAKHTSLG